MPDVYTHGHHDSVLRSHRWRTAENSAAYLLPHLQPEMSLLDLGCGPGTITADFARLLSHGRVLGIDASEEVVAEATQQFTSVTNLEFAVGDLYHLDIDDDTYDVVHAHQVLQHLQDPVAALVEMRRVVKPSGIIAVRDADFAGFHWAPRDPRLDRWMDIYHQVTRRNGAEADAGRFLLTWARQAGLSDIHVTGTLWTFADHASRTWWGDSWKERVVRSSFAEQAVAYAIATKAELADIADAWQAWQDDENAFFGVPNIEVIASK